ncbi:hypothetical protein AAFC00_005932 [Neodothiora populina]|uniref:RING-type E3 ubiquitin transferase n=1 Tax=Neodothiora populina TaxID=2781224 RepID=A0ABR3P6D2_9PEZI
MRLAVYAGTSALVAAGALLKAFHQRPNFYSATVYLSQSNACVLILTNLALVGACTFIYGLQRLFYGPLRQIEIEQLTEKAWYAVLDTLLAMPSLSHDVSGWMLTIFVLLLAGKVWGWIGEGRVDILEQQPPANPRTFHARLSSSLIVSVLFDACLLRYCVKTVLDDPRPGMMVIFTFEFAIQSIFSLFTLARYVLALFEAQILKTQTEQKIEERRMEIRAERDRIQQELANAEGTLGATSASQFNLPSEEDVDENEIDVPGWEEKRRWLFGLELATDFIKLVIYSVFFAISLTFMGLPMHIMRDVYLTFSAFAKRIQDYNNYRKATQNMNDKYPDATAEELSNDNTCIVCRESMVPWSERENVVAEGRRPTPLNEGLRAKKLPCGHILHLRCLKAWLERQQTCPTCRRPVVGEQSSRGTAPGQNRNEDPNAPQQPGVGGNAQQPGNNVAPAQGQAPQRPNRLRMLNLGPIRIGLYNGPAHRIQEVLGQHRNAQAQPTPPTTTDRSNQSSGDNSALEIQSTQIQLMQVEERLMREASTLAIEQTQLLTVRALESELARLRGLLDRTQHGGSVPPMMANLAPRALSSGMPGMASQMPLPAAYAQLAAPAHFPQALQPIAGQAPLGTGHPALPHAMTLPEGWTVTPLHRLGGPAQPEHPIPGMQMPGERQPYAASPPASVAPHPVPTRAISPSAVQQDLRSPPAVPSIFTIAQPQVPAVEEVQNPRPCPRSPASTNGHHTSNVGSTHATSSDTSTPGQIDAQDSSPAAHVQPSAQTSPPPTLQPSSGWSFSDAGAQQGSTAGPSEAHVNVESAEEGPSTSATEPSSSSAKGKAKAVTMEEVKDAGE